MSDSERDYRLSLPLHKETREDLYFMEHVIWKSNNLEPQTDVITDPTESSHATSMSLSEREYRLNLPLMMETRQDLYFMENVIWKNNRRVRNTEQNTSVKPTCSSYKVPRNSSNGNKKKPKSKLLYSPYPRCPPSPSSLTPKNVERKHDLLQDFCDAFVPFLVKFPEFRYCEPIWDLFNQIKAEHNSNNNIGYFSTK